MVDAVNCLENGLRLVDFRSGDWSENGRDHCTTRQFDWFGTIFL